MWTSCPTVPAFSLGVPPTALPRARAIPLHASCPVLLVSSRHVCLVKPKSQACTKLQGSLGKQVFWRLPGEGIATKVGSFWKELCNVRSSRKVRQSLALQAETCWAWGRKTKRFLASLFYFSFTYSEKTASRNENDKDLILVCAILAVYPALHMLS